MFIMSRLPITQEGYNQLQERLRYLREEKKPAIISAIASSRELGDLSENAEYQEARKEQSFVEGEIIKIENQLANAEIVKTAQLSGNIVKFGAFVTILNQENEKILTYQVVSNVEADIAKKKISISSPIGKALINKKLGDVVEVLLPGGSKYYEILKVEFK
jgi:transcription elongation factor GreA